MGKFQSLGLLIAALLLNTCEARVIHVEPLVSLFTDFLYSFDAGIENFLRNICDCSKVISCTCSIRLGDVTIRSQVTLMNTTENGGERNHDLECTIDIGGYEIFNKKTNVQKLTQKYSVFEDRDTYVMNKNYSIKFNVEENDHKVKVCADLEINEEKKSIRDERILCVQDAGKNGERVTSKQNSEEYELKQVSMLDSKQTPKLESKQTPKLESKQTPKLESKQTPKLESKQTPKLESKQTPKLESKQTPKLESKQTPKLESKQTPKLESKQTPKLESKQTPKLESKQTPKLDSKQTPKLASKQTPKLG